MEFLPIEIDNRKVYAGFGIRLGSAIVDMLVILPFIFLIHFIENISLLVAIISLVFSSVLISVYFVYFHYKFGATIGKMVFGIRVTLPNGGKIGLKHAFLRYSVDLAFTLIIVFAEVVAISNADPDVYLSAGWMEQSNYLLPLFPVWYVGVDLANQVWIWGEFIVLLCNKRKRAIHDFIAGTVVIRQEYAEQGTQQKAVDSALFS